MVQIPQSILSSNVAGEHRATVLSPLAYIAAPSSAYSTRLSASALHANLPRFGLTFND